MSEVARRIRVKVGPSGGEFVENVQGVGQAALVIGVEFGDARRQPGGLPAADFVEQVGSLG
ncbi:hypothetical protein D3C83_246370 [compost metagenome]